jgi:hypothetical protein
MEGDCVASTMVKIHVRARVIKTLFGRAQRDSTVGKNGARRGSNERPRSGASSARKLMAIPDNRVRSEIIADVSGLDAERTKETTSVGQSPAEDLQMSPSFVMLLAMVSHDSSVSCWNSFE